MVYNEQLAGRIRALAKRKRLAEKKMFGGVVFMLNGNMCFGVDRDNLMVRVALSDKAKPLPFQTQGRWTLRGTP